MNLERNWKGTDE